MYAGVTLVRTARADGNGPEKWKAQIAAGGVKFHLGSFATEVEAGVQFARAYHKLFGSALPLDVTGDAPVPTKAFFQKHCWLMVVLPLYRLLQEYAGDVTGRSFLGQQVSDADAHDALQKLVHEGRHRRAQRGGPLHAVAA